MEIRILKSGDAAIYRELRLKGLREDSAAFGSSYEEEVQYSVEQFIDRMSPSDVNGQFLFGAFEGEALIGVVGLARLKKVKLRHTADIWGMYVHSEHRGNGVGGRLLDEAIAHAKGLDGVRRIRLAVSVENEPARELYRSRGFECYGLEPEALFVDGKYYDEELYILRLVS